MSRTIDLSTAPAQIAGMLLDPQVDDSAVTAGLTALVGERPARHLLAAAHGIAADRLWTETA